MVYSLHLKVVKTNHHDTFLNYKHIKTKNSKKDYLEKFLFTFVNFDHLIQNGVQLLFMIGAVMKFNLILVISF